MLYQLSILQLQAGSSIHYPARGRKHHFPDEKHLNSLFINPLPRKGTETLQESSQSPNLRKFINPLPRKGTETLAADVG